VAIPIWWRRARQHFSIDAPRMAVRSRLPWPWRATVVAALVAVIAGMWWWGFDFGQLFGGFNRKEVETELATLRAENARLRAESAQLAAKSAQQESEIAMMTGAQATLGRQALELQRENSQVREELVFLQQLLADSSRRAGLAIQRLSVEPERDGAWRYRLLLVRGGSPAAEFEGHLTLQVTLAPPPDGAPPAGKPVVVTLPDEQPEGAAALKLRFKYYQRVEGTFSLPPGAQVRSISVRAFEAGEAAPRATRTLVIA
jgi:hypothetical protein